MWRFKCYNLKKHLLTLLIFGFAFDKLIKQPQTVSYYVLNDKRQLTEVTLAI